MRRDSVRTVISRRRAMRWLRRRSSTERVWGGKYIMGIKGFWEISVNSVYLVLWIKAFYNEAGKVQKVWRSRSIFHQIILRFHYEVNEVCVQPVSQSWLCRNWMKELCFKFGWGMLSVDFDLRKHSRKCGAWERKRSSWHKATFSRGCVVTQSSVIHVSTK